MTALTLVALAEIIIFSLGAMVGANLQDRVHEQERRRWLIRNRTLHEQVALLVSYATDSENEMRWCTKRQAGLVVIDYEAGD